MAVAVFLAVRALNRGSVVERATRTPNFELLYYFSDLRLTPQGVLTPQIGNPALTQNSSVRFFLLRLTCCYMACLMWI